MLHEWQTDTSVKPKGHDEASLWFWIIFSNGSTYMFNKKQLDWLKELHISYWYAMKIIIGLDKLAPVPDLNHFRTVSNTVYRPVTWATELFEMQQDEGWNLVLVRSRWMSVKPQWPHLGAVLRRWSVLTQPFTQYFEYVLLSTSCACFCFFLCGKTWLHGLWSLPMLWHCGVTHLTRSPR